MPVDSATRNVSGIGNVVERRLAYAIDYKTEGYYVLMTFVSGPAFPRELDRKLRIAEGVMRSLIVCKDE